MGGIFEFELTNLSFQLHAIAKMDGQLSNKAERVLIRSLAVETENLRGRVLHESDRRQGMGGGIFRGFK
jgi:hypothetical protein